MISRPIDYAKRPPGWGEDALTGFFEMAADNRLATYANKPMARKLVAIDAQFAVASSNWINPKSLVCAQLLLRSHSAFRAATALAFSGQVPECFALCRLFIEYAAYAVHIILTPGLDELWLRWHDNEASLKQQKADFAFGKVTASVVNANRHAGARLQRFYQEAIDFGAHPNERSVTGYMSLRESDDQIHQEAVYLQGDGVRLDYGLVFTARCGINALEMLELVFPERFELLGVRSATLELRKGL